jgi:AraC-like DNA-binding protein
MDNPRLDRLSAILEGLAPQIAVRFAGALEESKNFQADDAISLRMHLTMEGDTSIEYSGRMKYSLPSPAIVIVRGDSAHTIRPKAGKTRPSVMCIDTYFKGPIGSLLLEAFAQPLVLALESTDVELDLVIRLIASEVAYPRCGHPALLTRAGDILFIGVLRHLLAHPRTSSGLLSGLADQRIARALVAMHTTPEMAWSLEAMADVAGMSRTAFANRFRDVMSHTPGGYLTRLRLSIARRAVSNGQGLKQAAKLSGYASVTALSRALTQNANAH